MKPSPSTPHWAHMQEHTFVLGITLLYWVHRLLGRHVFRWAMQPVVWCHWWSRPALRAASLEYLQRLQQHTGALGRAVRASDGRRHVALFAETMLDKLLAMAGRYPVARVSHSGGAPIYQAALAGQGSIIVTAHMGCLELCQVLAEQLPGFRLTVLVHTRHAEQFNRLLRRLHPEAAVELIEVTDISPATAVLLEEKIASGACVAIAGDRIPVFASQTVSVDFLGQAAPFPVGPYVLASLLKCPLYLLACVHQGAGYHLHFEPLAAQVRLPRGQRQEAMQHYASLYAAALTRRLAASPYDWFNFFPFWQQTHAPTPQR